MRAHRQRRDTAVPGVDAYFLLQVASNPMRAKRMRARALVVQ